MALEKIKETRYEGHFTYKYYKYILLIKYYKR